MRHDDDCNPEAEKLDINLRLDIKLPVRFEFHIYLHGDETSSQIRAVTKDVMAQTEKLKQALASTPPVEPAP